MYYQIVSFSHKNCEQSMREKLAFPNDEEKATFLEQLTGFEFVHEAFIISTCNRVEIVMATRDNFSSYHAVLGLMSQKGGLNFYELKSTAKRYDDEEAIEHIFSVVSSLDSLVIGESQITGQVKEAFRFSFQHGTAGRRLNRVLSYAVKCAAEVRNATNISQNPISIASVAVAQAHKLLGDNIQGMKGIVVGAGDMGVLAAKHLLRVGCDVVLIGRDLDKVQTVADSLGEDVKADTMENLTKYINRYRLLFSATSSPEPVITGDLIENETLPRQWFDMAIPRDIEDMELEKLQLFRIDDLRAISNDNHAMREEQAVRANEIVERYTEEFYAWLKALSIEPVIKQMRQHVSAAIEKEMQRALKKGFVPKEYESNMRKMAEQMFNRFLHDPTQNLRASSTESKNTNCIESVKKMFNIDTEHVDFKQYKNDHHTKGYSA
ncbi:glutamyl-tRNA reductase [Sulfurovum sp. NBC37-1]|uniref:Glutamyl-tRNA reductase n=1 Tax=Sulfurovum sp. (strain NBC37-1) TaxID=387093 RepID=HEM1_SULNB|nr:glutamyl-tRNA reductase [Sulfurovum sp. NBC37-1]A6Q7Y8.1 RecName: Full=Glutamyl-tRNA reductase; Short=GluTR [Sulfurovum sp. NBC37-1]BAF71597.1 glutamyl-tRNA reductase [Sulfurovum sp. NBC37-1]